MSRTCACMVMVTRFDSQTSYVLYTDATLGCDNVMLCDTRERYE